MSKTASPNTAIPPGFSLFRDDLDYVADALRPLAALRGARLLITGGTGFFGVWLTESLLWASRCLDLDISLTLTGKSARADWLRRYPHLRGQAIRYQQADFSGPARLDGDYTHIIHAATVPAGPDTSAWAGVHLDAVFYGAKAALDAAERCRADMLILSSGGVYKTPAARMTRGRKMIEEFDGPDALLAETPVYALGKRLAETLSAAAAGKAGFRALIARPFAFIGPWLPLDANYAAGNFIRDALHGGPIRVSGDGTPLRSYMYAADMVVWLLHILMRGRSGRPYNVGGAKAVSIFALARTVARCAGLPPERVFVASQPPERGAPPAYVPDIRRARTELGLSPGLGLDEAVSRTLRWHQIKSSTGH